MALLFQSNLATSAYIARTKTDEKSSPIKIYEYWFSINKNATSNMLKNFKR